MNFPTKFSTTQRQNITGATAGVLGSSAAVYLALCIRAAQLLTHALARLPEEDLRFAERERLHRALARVQRAVAATEMNVRRQQLRRRKAPGVSFPASER
jgi:hypothetical protein